MTLRLHVQSTPKAVLRLPQGLREQLLQGHRATHQSMVMVTLEG